MRTVVLEIEAGELLMRFEYDAAVIAALKGLRCRWGPGRPRLELPGLARPQGRGHCSREAHAGHLAAEFQGNVAKPSLAAISAGIAPG